MKKIVLWFSLLVLTLVSPAQVYMAKTCTIRFFSSTPLRDIDAQSTTCKPMLNTQTGEVAARVSISGFLFENKLMQEHFNENYMESDKYPHAVFTGTINEKIDYTKNGTTQVTIMGKLMLHGVEKERIVNGALTINNNQISVDLKFNVALEDHKIKVPTVVSQEIAREVEVSLNALLEPFVKK